MFKNNLLEKFLYIIIFLLGLGFIFFFSRGCNYYVNAGKIIILTLILCLISYFFSLILSKVKKDNCYMKWNLKIFFGVYLVLLLFLTIIRNVDFKSFNITLNSSINLIPFKETIYLIKEILSHGYSSRITLIIGNILCFIPLAYLLPRIYKKNISYKKFCLIIFFLTFFIEINQYIFARGVFDIDDIIYNSLGALICYYPFNKTFIGDFLDKIILLQSNKLSKNKVIVSLFIIFAIIISILSCMYFYYFYDGAIYYNVSLINESSSCSNKKEYFYEEQYFRYYFPCEMSNDVYLRIDKHEKTTKYLLIDILNNKVDYSIELMQFIDNKIIFSESKGLDIPITYTGFGYYVDVNVKNHDILDAKEGYTVYNDNVITYDYLIVPKEIGLTKVDFNIMKNDEVIKTISYNIKVISSDKIEYQQLN